MFIEWQDSYSVGDPFIDSQHQELFDIANKIFECDDQAEMIFNFMHLFRYVRRHFNDEEELMHTECYEMYSYHCDLHLKMIGHLEKLSDAIGHGDLNLKEVHSFMAEWLLGHICTEDRKMIEFIKG